jgi:threonine/homoserine/homoserine lactone efflux protein
LTVAVSLHSGLPAAARAICGICTGSLTYLAVALAGLLAVFVAHRPLFHAVQIGGALYLLYLGLRMVQGGLRASSALQPEVRVHERPYVDGLVTQLSNPKAMLYWTALLPPFLDVSRPLASQLLVLLAIGISVDIVVLSLYAFGAARVRLWMREPRLQRRLNLAAGVLFGVTGVTLTIAGVAALRS